MPQKTNGTNSTPESKVRRVITLLAQLREALDALEPGQEAIFGDGLRQGLEQANGRKGFYPQYYADVKPRLSPKEKSIQNARGTVERLRAQLKELKSKQKRAYYPGERPPKGLDDAIERMQEQLEQAENQLARLEGTDKDREVARKAEAEAARQAEAMQEAQGIAAYQARMRALFTGKQNHGR